jgi:hypothetical protein
MKQLAILPKATLRTSLLVVRGDDNDCTGGAFTFRRSLCLTRKGLAPASNFQILANSSNLLTVNCGQAGTRPGLL